MVFEIRHVSKQIKKDCTHKAVLFCLLKIGCFDYKWMASSKATSIASLMLSEIVGCG